MGIGAQLKHAWNAFTNQDTTYRRSPQDFGAAYGGRPDRVRMGVTNERSIISSIYTRLSIDISSHLIRHIRLDEKGRYIGDMDSGLNNCLSLEANIDQNSQDFLQDHASTLFDKGTSVIVPVDTSLDPMSAGYDIKTLRIGRVVQWYPRHVRVELYNDTTGRYEELTLPKDFVAIVYNPLYAVMNEPNSTLQRIINKLNLLDAIDKQSGTGKLDLIIQLPYAVKHSTRKEQAASRRAEIEGQLKDSQYGIAYTDGTEKITQLNRPAENNLMKQIEYLLTMLYGQLGLTAGVMDGTADEKAMLNYYNRTIDPILSTTVLEMRRKFLTKTARTQRQSVDYFRANPFKLVPMSELAEMSDKFTRNEILSSNEIRQFLGIQPSTDPKADQLINSNMPQAAAALPPATGEVVPGEAVAPVEDNSDLDAIESGIDQTFIDLGLDPNGEDINVAV